MSQARRLTHGTASGRKERQFGPRQNASGPWPRLRAVIKAGQGGKPVDLAELSQLIEAAGRTPPSRVGRAESTTYALATALRNRLTQED
jgi:hypothetical protein